MKKINLETAREIIDFSGGKKELESLAEMQLEGAVALHNMIVDSEVGLGYLADEVGMGKTYVALGVVALMRYFNPSLKVLYICPSNNVQDKWLREYHSFIEKNLKVSHYRIRTPQGRPAMPYVTCKRVVDLIEHAASGYYADFFVGKGMFSMAMSDDEKSLKEKRKELEILLPGFVQRDLEKEDLHTEVKDEYARALNHILPTFDLVVIDESHNFKHPFDSSDRNRVLSQILGFNKERGGFHPRVKNALLLSATPYDRNIDHLRNQLKLVGKSKLLPEKVKREDTLEIISYLKKFMVRRLNQLEINNKQHTRNMYRKEARKEAAIELLDDEQKLVTALMQKKVGELLGKKGGNPSFQTGMLASFESYQDTAGSGAIEFDGDKSDKKSADAKDRQIVATLVNSYKELKLGRTLPHPKMDAVTKNLADKIFNKGQKQLVFVRRVKSVKELKEKLDEHYNDWLEGYLCNNTPNSLLPLIKSIWLLYKEKSQKKDHDLSGGEIGKENDKGEATSVRRNDTFFTWFFYGPAEDEVEALLKQFGQGWQTPEQIRISLTQRSQSASTLLEVNWTFFLTKYLEIDLQHLMVDDGFLSYLAAHAGFFLGEKSTEKHYLDIFRAVQAAFLQYLIQEKGLSGFSVIAERFLPIRRDSPVFTISVEQVRDNLVLPTFYQALSEKAILNKLLPLLKPSIKLAYENKTEEAQQNLRVLEVHIVLIDILVRTAHGMIDLYLSRLVIGDGELNTARRKQWMNAFAERLETQRNSSALSTYNELRQLAENIDLVIKVNVPDIFLQDRAEYRKYLSNLINPVFPFFGASGETVGQRSAQARKFRMPGYPLALISTDVFQEGEDLHTFCADVVHYGLSGSPVSIEQKIGRVDRVSSLAQRRLLKGDSVSELDFIQVVYPFVSESIELLQVRRLCSNINEFIESLHEIEKPRTLANDEVDTAQEMLDRSVIPNQISTFLKSPYAINFLGENLSDRTQEIRELGYRNQKACEHIELLVSETLDKLGYSTPLVENAITHSNFDTLNRLERGRAVVQLLSARASSELLLSWTRMLDTPEYDDFPLSNGKDLVCWIQTNCWTTFFRHYVIKQSDGTYARYENAELLVGGKEITQQNDIKVFLEGVGLRGKKHETNYMPLTDGKILNYVKDLIKEDFWQFDASKSVQCTVKDLKKKPHIIFEFRPISGKRKHNVYLLEHDGRCIFISKILDAEQVKKLSYKQIMKYTLERNRQVDLVEFVINAEGDLVARVDHPLDSLDKYELIYTGFCLAAEADRLEYVLSVTDEF